MITQERLKELFEYRDGKLIWKINNRRIKKGRELGCTGAQGYILGQVDKIQYRVHRLVFLYHFGYLPEIVDHIDGDKLNNRIENLRAATNQTNQWNAKTPKSNTSGVKGVSWRKGRGRWIVTLSVEGSRKYFGSYRDLELAELVAQEAREKYHREFTRHE